MICYVAPRLISLAMFVLAIAFVLNGVLFVHSRGNDGTPCGLGCTEEQIHALKKAYGLDRNYLEVTRDNLRNDNKWLLGIPILLAAIALDRAIVSRDRQRLAIGHQLPPLVPNP